MRLIRTTRKVTWADAYGRMNKIIVVMLALALSACASTQQTVASPDPSRLVVSEEPAGYPITTNVRIGDVCTVVKESWLPFKDPASGKQLWLKQVERVDGPCQ